MYGSLSAVSFHSSNDRKSTVRSALPFIKACFFAQKNGTKYISSDYAIAILRGHVRPVMAEGHAMLLRNRVLSGWRTLPARSLLRNRVLSRSQVNNNVISAALY